MGIVSERTVLTMRDRLIELLNKTFAEQYDKRGLLTAPHTADHLLANGVIVPLCKVGDTVYCLETIGNPINSYVVQNIGITATQGGWGIERGFNDFGKTVFLTKEQAVQALKEREG